MQQMIARLLGLPKPPTPADAADALGLALIHLSAGKLRRLAAGA
jgi:Holliday junction resolvasome RuvABC endonuclease subunit